MHKNSLNKEERLCSRKVIERLFSDGENIFVFPFKVVFLECSSLSPVQAAFSVSKRNFKLAVTRNLIKRRMREAYRLNKTVLYESVAENSESQLAVMFIYTGKEVRDYSVIEKGMKKAIAKLAGHIK